MAHKTKRCPQCGDDLKHWHSKKEGRWIWSHAYTLAEVMSLSAKQICDYSEKEGTK